MARYLSLVRTYFRAALLVELEYRLNFLGGLVMVCVWTAWILAGISSFFYHRETLGGWTYDEALMVAGLFVVYGAFMDMILRPNVTRLVELIQKGTLDFVLVKPASSQFLATLTAFSSLRVVDLTAGFVILGVGLWRQGTVPGASSIAMFLIMVPCGMVMAYSMWLMLMSVAFWFIKVDNITELFSGFFEAGRLPVTVYRGWLRALLTFVVPVAFLTTFPAAVLIGRASWVYVAGAVALAVVLAALSAAFWRYAIRFYSSASS